MPKGWQILFQTAVLSVIVSGAAFPLLCSAEEETAAANTVSQGSQDAGLEIYRSQIEKYPALNKEFAGVFEADMQPRAVPTGSDEVYRWQLDEYKMLNADFNEVYTRNIEPRPVPPSVEEIYLRQLEEYKELDKEFYNEHRREF